MKIFPLIAVLFFGYSSITISQSHNQEIVIGIAGGTHHLSGAYVDWTLGEWMVESFDDQVFFEQGFLHLFNLYQQSTPSKIFNKRISSVDVFPNPTNGSFNLGINDHGFDEILLADLHGRIHNTWITKNDSYNVSSITPGMYLVITLKNGVMTHFAPLSIIH
jgi:hypothetical protein